MAGEIICDCSDLWTGCEVNFCSVAVPVARPVRNLVIVGPVARLRSKILLCYCACGQAEKESNFVSSHVV